MIAGRGLLQVSVHRMSTWMLFHEKSPSRPVEELIWRFLSLVSCLVALRRVRLLLGWVTVCGRVNYLGM